MKKTKLFAALLASAILGLPGASACTNILVTKGASKTGSTMISYSADSHTLYGELYYRPAADYPAGAMMKVYEWDTGRLMGEIPQAGHTYSVVGNMNEHQLLIGESTWGGLPQLVDTTGMLDYGSLMYIALQRCRTAREAIELMTRLVAEYGYASSGESISVADPNEVWVLEIIGKGTRIVKGKNVNKGAVWVARRIPDGEQSGDGQIPPELPGSGQPG
ncbi:C69 family dipeptidase, partial [uncultured Rikenella sp.]|uniref:C69 family dipeptidase n=1 Tax=uncultured Rikenella sp. TaxID=368003 RepID=UPI0026280B36